MKYITWVVCHQPPPVYNKLGTSVEMKEKEQWVLLREKKLGDCS